MWRFVSSLGCGWRARQGRGTGKRWNWPSGPPDLSDVIVSPFDMH
ncbi:hypothetical protein [Sulfitobacter sp. 1A15142]